MNSGALLPLRAIVVTDDLTEHPPATRPSDIGNPSAPIGHEISDEALLLNAGKGSKEAIGILFQRHGGSVLNVAYRILHDESEATDLRQEVFIYLFQRAQLYDARKSSAISWIMQITYHRAFNRRRFLTARRHYQVEELHEQHTESVVPYSSLDQLDAQWILERFRGQLTREQQEALELHLFEGYTFQEIAERSGQTAGNVKHYYYRGLEKLRSILTSGKRR